MQEVRDSGERPGEMNLTSIFSTLMLLSSGCRGALEFSKNCCYYSAFRWLHDASTES